MALEFEDFVTGLTEETTPDNAADFLVIVDISGSDVNKVKPATLLGTDLTAIRALTPSNDDVLQRKAGAWVNRTIAQLKSDLAITENATHTGDVTGSTALTIDKTAITGKTLVTAAVGDHVLVADASDSDNLKKVTVQTIVDLAGGGGVAIGDTITSATAGSVFFAGAGGVLAQNNANLFWDDANNVLRAPALQHPNSIYDQITWNNSGGGGTNDLTMQFSSRGGNTIRFDGTNGLLPIQAIPLGSATYGWNGVWINTATAATVGVTVNLAVSQTADAFQVKNSGGATVFAVSGAGALHLQEMTAPSAPSANNVYIYAEDNGSGKTRLMARFGSGAAQQIAIEP